MAWRVSAKVRGSICQCKLRHESNLIPSVRQSMLKDVDVYRMTVKHCILEERRRTLPRQPTTWTEEARVTRRTQKREESIHKNRAGAAYQCDEGATRQKKEKRYIGGRSDSGTEGAVHKKGRSHPRQKEGATWSEVEGAIPCKGAATQQSQDRSMGGDRYELCRIDGAT